MPLHEAAWRGLSEVIQLLLGLNAPAHPRTLEGETPLMLAQRKGFQDCVEILRKKIKKEGEKSFIIIIFFSNLNENFITGKYKAPKPVLSKYNWYHGTLDRKEAVELLKEYGNKEGSYLVRYSHKNGGVYVLTMIVNDRSFHFQIKNEVYIIIIIKFFTFSHDFPYYQQINFFFFFQNGYYFIDDGPLLESLEHVIDYYSRMQDGLPTVLQIPVPPKPKPPVPEFPRHGVRHLFTSSPPCFFHLLHVMVVLRLAFSHDAFKKKESPKRRW